MSFSQICKVMKYLLLAYSDFAAIHNFDVQYDEIGNENI